MALRIETANERIRWFRYAALFEGLTIEQEPGVLLVLDEYQIVGSVIYHPYQDGVIIEYLGYGDRLHPIRDADRIAKFKKRYPNLGIDLLLWARNNLPEPRYAAFANEDLAKAMNAKPIGESFHISPEMARDLGENRTEIPIQRIHRSNLH